MDNRITKTRLSNLLSYDWLKIIAIIVAIAIFWSLAFTIGAPRASVGQMFGLLTYAPDFGVGDSEGLVLSKAAKNGAFSYDILGFNTRAMQPDYYATIMTAADSVKEGDVFITSDFDETKEKNQSPFRSFVDGFFGRVFDIDELIKEAKSYAIKSGVVLSEGKYSLDDSVAESVFATRMEKDPRFRNGKSERYKKGVECEKERIIAVWNNACKLEKVLSEHEELRVKYRPFDQRINSIEEKDREKDSTYTYWTEHPEEKTYAINLGKLVGGENNITNQYSRSISKEGEDPVLSADGIVLCVFNYTSAQPHLQYETLGFIVYFIETYSNFLESAPENLIVRA